LIAALLASGCTPTPVAPVERLDVRLMVRDDGSVDASERLQARVDGDRFRLRKPLDRQDEIVDVEAFLGQAPAPAGDQPGQARISGGDGIDVEWQVQAPGAYEFEVRYRAIGAVAVRGGHAALSWPVLPATPPLADAAVVDVALTLPPATQLSGEPYVEDGQGWTVTREDGAIRVRGRPSSIESGAVLVVPFLVDPRAIDEPIWLRDALRARDLLPSFISAAVFVLVVAAGVLVMIGVQYPRRSGGPPATVAAGLRIAGVVTMLFGLLAVPLTEWGLGRYGAWAHAMPISVIVGGLAFLIYGVARRSPGGTGADRARGTASRQ
jgi:hypothetical protein